MSQPVLSIRQLCVSFSGQAGARVGAVEDLSLDLAPGELTALVGESGSGKSVSALSVLGLLPMPPARIDAGSIRYTDANGADHELVGASAKRMRAVRGGEIAMIFQEPMTSLNPVLSIGSQIVEAVRLHRRVSVKAARAIAVEATKRGATIANNLFILRSTPAVFKVRPFNPPPRVNRQRFNTSMCGGWLRRIVSVVVLMVVVMVKQAQEHHGEEHENEGLQKGHKQFEEVEGEARSGTNNGSDLGASQILQDTKAKAKEASSGKWTKNPLEEIPVIQIYTVKGLSL